MRFTLAAVAAAILLALSALHVYWATGGRWAINVAVPSFEGRPLFRPGAAGTFAVAVLLALAAWVLIGRHVDSTYPSRWVYVVGAWCVAAAFTLRAIGDFRYVGFFKRMRGAALANTPFAIWDDKLFSPLCLTLALLVAASLVLDGR